MKRRPFIKNTFRSFPAILMASNQSFIENKKILRRIKPQRLRKNDTVGLIAPGGPISDEKIQLAFKNLESIGLKVKLSKNIRAKRGFNAGTDTQRLEDLHQSFTDNSLNGVWCIRGGYGCTRLLPLIDYKKIKRNPKVLIGFSDITALINAIYLKTGLIGFHGPVATWDFDDFNRGSLEQILFNGFKESTIIQGNESVEVLSKGKATGELIGGNLTILASLAGTKFGIDAKDKIVFLEDVGEKPYRIDRMLTQLRQSANLKLAKGILIGEFTDCEAEPDDNSLTLIETLKDRLGNLGIPVIYNFPFGHNQNMCTIPVGIKASFDTTTQKMVLEENSVG